MDSSDVVRALAPHGRLRAAINLSNALLVSGTKDNGTPFGIAADLAGELAARIGVPLELIAFPSPSALADCAGRDVWDIGLIAAEPVRAENIAFTRPYTEIPATYLVRADTPFMEIGDVDRPGTRISAYGGSAYDLWLSRHITKATIVRADSLQGSYALFHEQRLEALAGLRANLLEQSPGMPGTRILPGGFARVQQAIGTARANTTGAAFLNAFVDEVLRTGLVQHLIDRYQLQGLDAAS